MSDSPSPATAALTATGAGVSVERRQTEAGTHPFDAVEWEIRDAVIGDPEAPAFEQRGVEFPATWSQNATNIVAQKYFRGRMDSPERERSVKQMVGRVAGTIAAWGREGGYFASHADAESFEHELTHILLHQQAAFNSRSGSTSASRSTRSARPASSSASTTPWSRSSTGTPRRARSSAVARARASTSRTSGAPPST